MKKFINLLVLLITLSPAFAQEWETVKIDSVVLVKLPKGFTKTDTVNKYSLVANSPFGTILIFKSEDTPKVTPDIEKERHLRKFYDNYLTSIKELSSASSIKDEKDNLLGKLKVKDFTLQTDSGSGILYRDFRILHTNGATYIFEFLYKDIHKEYALPEREQFFNSIVLNDNLESADQFTNAEVKSEGHSNKSNYFIAGGISLILFAIMIIFKYRRKQTPAGLKHKLP